MIYIAHQTKKETFECLTATRCVIGTYNSDTSHNTLVPPPLTCSLAPLLHYPLAGHHAFKQPLVPLLIIRHRCFSANL